MSPLLFRGLILALLGQVTLGVNPLDSILSETVEKVLQGMEARLAQQEAVFRQLLVEQAESIHGQLGAFESHLAQHTEAVDARLVTLKTELENTTTNRLAALEERMVVENRNLVTNSESRLNLTIGAMMNSMERRLADQTGTMESRLVGLAANMESRLAVLTGTIESRLVQQAEAVNVRLATLKTDLKNTTTDLLEALEERMVVENRNVTTNSESRLNLTIGATMNSMEERIRYEIRTVSNTTEIQLKAAQTQTNVTVGAVLHGVEASLTTLCSSRGSDQLIAAVYNMSKAQLHILWLLESHGPPTFLRRVDGSVNFQRNWAEYKSGFGDNNEFWLGLEKLHQLTTIHQYGLRVDMEDFSGERKWALYQSFRVGTESGNYVLTVTGYNPDSTAGDSMTYHNGTQFSTYDRDNDGYGGNCAAVYKGGWWYNNCIRAQPTGLYKPAGDRSSLGITWLYAYGDWRSFKSISLKLVGN